MNIWANVVIPVLDELTDEELASGKGIDIVKASFRMADEMIIASEERLEKPQGGHR